MTENMYLSSALYKVVNSLKDENFSKILEAHLWKSLHFIRIACRLSIKLSDLFNLEFAYRDYLKERQGAHLIFYLSEDALIWGGRSFKQRRSLKKCKVGTS